MKVSSCWAESLCPLAAECIPSAKTLVIVASMLNGQTATLCSWIHLHYHNSTASWFYFVILVVIGP